MQKQKNFFFFFFYSHFNHAYRFTSNATSAVSLEHEIRQWVPRWKLMGQNAVLAKCGQFPVNVLHNSSIKLHWISGLRHPFFKEESAGKRCWECAAASWDARPGCDLRWTNHYQCPQDRRLSVSNQEWTLESDWNAASAFHKSRQYSIRRGQIKSLWGRNKTGGRGTYPPPTPTPNHFPPIHHGYCRVVTRDSSPTNHRHESLGTDSKQETLKDSRNGKHTHTHMLHARAHAMTHTHTCARARMYARTNARTIHTHIQGQTERQRPS